MPCPATARALARSHCWLAVARALKIAPHRPIKRAAPRWPRSERPQGERRFQPREGGKDTLHMALVDSTQQLLEAAMRGSWQRETALTNNIANADTPGYQPQEVNFESALQSAISGGESPSQLQFQTDDTARRKRARTAPASASIRNPRSSPKTASTTRRSRRWSAPATTSCAPRWAPAAPDGPLRRDRRSPAAASPRSASAWT